MCGIAGVAGADAALRTRAMLPLLRHRGPDDSGLFANDEVAIGATRLSIIDIEGGHQPLANEDGTVHATLNGEIYNFPALRERLAATGHELRTRSDTEVLVHLYEDYGVELVHALDGMYAFAILDERNGRLVLGRDRLGEKPLFTWTHADELVFASELSAVRRGLPAPIDAIDPEALDLFFSLGYVPGPKTLIVGIEQLPPGAVGVWERGKGLRVSRYWKPPRHSPVCVDEDALLVEEAVALVTGAVESRMVSDVPVGVFLSGGVDSSLVTAIAARGASPRLKSFSVGYDVGVVSETESALRVAEAIGTDHHALTLTVDDVREQAPVALARLDQPIADPAFVALAALAVHAREHVTVVLGGEGADEIFGGYPRYRFLQRIPSRGWRGSAPVNRYAGALPARVRQVGGALRSDSGAAAHLEWVAGRRIAARASLYGPRLAGLTHSRPESHWGAVREAESESRAGYLMRLDAAWWLPDDVLAKADRATMLASLEFRAPFLARDLLEFAASVPPSVHLRDRGKYLLRAALERVLPGTGSMRRKVAFRVPLAEWLRRAFQETFEAQLEHSWLYDGWFDRSAVRLLYRQHCEGSVDHSQTLWPLFVLGCWTGAE